LQTHLIVVLPIPDMSYSRKSLVALLLLAFALIGLSGCTGNQQDSSIPWSRPASWEGRIPGMTGN
jgi:hypothetical protein